ncbi:MAG: SH3 domain-containing protein [Anaerolineae bacterium]|nr:SH3 domain-containing protein [Anaerolineae bacterium]MDQ7036801.1 SH3 domain-containing protein [Anaerolineae bacterium]
MRRFWIVAIVLLWSAVAVIAQECPTLEQAAVGETRAWCAGIASGEVCYGNSIVSAELASFAPDNMSFSAPSDTLALTDVTSLSTAIGDSLYGVALMQTIGYPVDSWQPQEITLVLLGDVILNNTAQEGVTVATNTTTITAAEGANVRTGTTTEFRVLTALFQGDIVKITGRLDDGSWLRVQLPDGRTGWIIATAVDDNLSQLPVVDVDSPQPELLYAPYTSFSLQTATVDNRCGQAWESGILLQSPQDTPVRLLVNNRFLLISGTIFLQAPLDTAFDIFVIDGFAVLDDIQVEEGYQAIISTEIDDTGNVLPAIISSYDFARMAHLPTEILPRYTYIGIDLSTIITPAPTIDRSPIIDTLATDSCVLTTGASGANLRSGPGSEFPIRGVLAFRETAHPIGRITGSDGGIWWELAQNIWISASVVVTGGDCAAVPQSQRVPNPPPPATPEN